MGVGEGIGSDGPGRRTGGARARARERKRRERRRRRKCVLLLGSCSCFVWTNDCVVFSLLSLFLLGFLDGCCLVMCSAYYCLWLSLCLCGGVAYCLSLLLSLSPLRKGMERDLVSKLRARTGRFVDIWSLYSLSPLLILAHFYPPISTLPTHSSPE